MTCGDLQAALAIKITSTALANRVRSDAAVREAVQETLQSVRDVAYGNDEHVPALSLQHMWDLSMAGDGDGGGGSGGGAEATAKGCASICVFLVCATFLERALGDVLYSATRALASRTDAPSRSANTAAYASEETDSLAVPAILRDLLRSPLLLQLLGVARVRVLRLFLAAPAALNARNVCWHGFVAAQDWPTHYTYFALLLLASLDPLVRRLAVTRDAPLFASQPVPVPFLKRRKLSLSGYTSAFPLRMLLGDHLQTCGWLEQVCASPVLPQGRAPMLRWAVLHSNNPLLKAVVLLPVLEQLLRQIYVARNDLPREMLSAQSRVYYVRIRSSCLIG